MDDIAAFFAGADAPEPEPEAEDYSGIRHVEPLRSHLDQRYLAGVSSLHQYIPTQDFLDWAEDNISGEYQFWGMLWYDCHQVSGSMYKPMITFEVETDALLYKMTFL